MRRTDVVGAPEAARLLGVNLKTVHNWARRGHLRCPKSPTGRVLVPREEIARLMTMMGAEISPEFLPFSRAPLPDVVRRVFVAGPSGELERCAKRILEVTIALSPGGVVDAREDDPVTLDWTPLVSDARVGALVPPMDQQARDCMSAVASADLVWLLLPSPGRSTVGAWWEAGAAGALRKPIVASYAFFGATHHAAEDTLRPIFPPPYSTLAHLQDSDAAALALIRERAPKVKVG